MALKMFFIISWRNIWRVKRRTAIILTAVIIGTWAMLFLDAFMRGMMEQLIANSIATLTGHIQIHHKGYSDDPVIENSMTDPQQVITLLDQLPQGSHWSPRIRVPGIINNARNSAGITVVGIDPEKEAHVSFIKNAMSSGEYLQPDDRYGILIGDKLIDKFDTKLGYKMVLMSQDTSEEIASAGFEIQGIFSAEMEDTEQQYAFITLDAAQQMLKADNYISEISILLPDRRQIPQVQAFLKSNLPDTYDILNWEELQPLTKAYVQIWNSFMYIWYLVVFCAMAFGLVNTMLMAVLERVREFGMLKAIGMKPYWIIIQILTETACLLVIGILIGNLLGWATVEYLSRIGINLSAWAEGAQHFGLSHIVYPVLYLSDLLIANAVVFILGLLVCTYPAVKAGRIVPVEALVYT